jgi:hypothetical protein
MHKEKENKMVEKLTMSSVIIGEMGGKASMTGGDKYFQNLVGNPVGEKKRLERCKCRCKD